MSRRTFISGLIALAAVMCATGIIGTAGAWPLQEVGFAGAQCWTPIDCNVNCLTWLVQNDPTCPNYDGTTNYPGCYLFGNGAWDGNYFKSCDTYDSNGTNYCSQMLGGNAYKSCTGKTWECPCATLNAAGTFATCNVVGCPCDQPGGTPATIEVMNLCT